MTSLPPLSSALIRKLDQEIPERCPSPSMTDRDIWLYAGKRQLIRDLLTQLKIQEEEDQGITNVFSQET